MHILVFCMHIYGGCAPGTVEFFDREACMAAKEVLETTALSSGFFGNKVDMAVCLPKTTTKTN